MERDVRSAQELSAAIAKKKRAIDAIDALIQLEGGEPEGLGTSSVTPFPASRSHRGTPISDAAYDVLKERGEEMHYQPLTHEVMLRGVPIGGKSPANTLLAHLSRDSRFSRPRARGTYALREWDPTAKSIGVRRKRRGA
jgi:hypothetical protein